MSIAVKMAQFNDRGVFYSVVSQEYAALLRPERGDMTWLLKASSPW